jgi:hypothetical protein
MRKLMICGAAIMACLLMSYPSYAIHDCEWTIDKSGDQSELTLAVGQQYTVYYSVTTYGIAGTGSLPCYGEVWDSNQVDISSNPTGSLGKFWQNSESNPKTFKYPFTIGPYLQCGEYQVPNTATLHLGYPYMDIVGPKDTWTVTVYVPCGGGCTLTQGYWKTHSQYGPAPYDATWAQVGEDTLFFSSGLTWHQTLSTPPAKGNVYYILAHQYIAAYLNVLRGADTSGITGVMDHAALLLSGFQPSTIMSVASAAEKSDFMTTAYLLDQYNNGFTGPGHCSE